MLGMVARLEKRSDERNEQHPRLMSMYSECQINLTRRVSDKVDEAWPEDGDSYCLFADADCSLHLLNTGSYLAHTIARKCEQCQDQSYTSKSPCIPISAHQARLYGLSLSPRSQAPRMQHRNSTQTLKLRGQCEINTPRSSLSGRCFDISILRVVSAYLAHLVKRKSQLHCPIHRSYKIVSVAYSVSAEVCLSRLSSSCL